MLQPTLVRVSRAAVVENYRQVCRQVGPKVRVCAVLKADAYGHGMTAVAEPLWEAGADWFAVATLTEALKLRASLGEAKILALLPCLPSQNPDAAEAVVRHRIRASVLDKADADALEAVADRLDCVAPIHVEIDTGLGRMGVPAREAADLLAHLSLRCRHLHLEGVFTHFADAEADDCDFARRQLEVFGDSLRRWRERMQQAESPDDSRLGRLTPIGRDFSPQRGSAMLADLPVEDRPVLHAANSAATLRLPEARLGLVRCGLALYGWSPFAARPNSKAGSGGSPHSVAATAGTDIARTDSARTLVTSNRTTGTAIAGTGTAGSAILRPALRVVSRLMAVKRLPAGHTVGYGRTWTAGRETLTGVVPIGYEDGFPRELGNAAVMTVGGVAVPVIGRVSMDQTIVDLTDLPTGLARVGAEVVVVSDDPAAPNSLPRLAEQAGTIPYELLCRLGNRLPRVYD